MWAVEMLFPGRNVWLLVEHRFRSGVAVASELSVTEAPAVYCHHVDRLCV